jgi:hypothetical protein
MLKLMRVMLGYEWTDDKPLKINQKKGHLHRL